MATVVLDSGNTEAMVRDATGEGLAPTAPPANDPAPATDAKSTALDADDTPGPDGLTPSEKRDLSNKMQRAIAKRVRETREAEEFAAAEFAARRQAEARAEFLERELQALKGQAPAAVSETTTAPQKPKREDFATDSQYIDATVSFEVNQRLAEREAQEAAERAKQQEAEILAAANERIQRAAEIVPDFVEVAEAAGDMRVPNEVAGYIQQSEMGPELAYFLAKNAEVVDSLWKMDGIKRLVEIGKIESKLPPFAAATKNSRPQATQQDTDGKPAPKAAPRNAAASSAEPSSARKGAPVITPISTNGSGSGDLHLETASVKEHITEFHRRKGVDLLRRQRH